MIKYCKLHDYVELLCYIVCIIFCSHASEVIHGRITFNCQSTTREFQYQRRKSQGGYWVFVKPFKCTGGFWIVGQYAIQEFLEVS